MSPAALTRTLFGLAPLLVAHRRRRPGATGGATPFTLSFLVTNRCGLKCRHCFYHAELAKPSDDELTLDEYDALSRRMGAFGVAVFAGGEPFARRDLWAIVNGFRARNAMPLAGIATNGQATGTIVRQTERMLAADRSKPLTLSFSLDGLREDHDVIRGRGTFDRALRTWRECRRLAAHHDNLLMTVTIVVNTLNEARAEAFVRWAGAALRPAAVNVMLVRQSPRDGEHLKRVSLPNYLRARDAALELAGVRSLRGLLDPQTLFLAAMGEHVERTVRSGRRSFACRAGDHGAVVDYKGDVNVCEVLSEDPATGVIGNLRDYGMDFGALWRSEPAARMRARVGRHAACRACTHETVGILPSLPFATSLLGELVGAGLRARRRLGETDVGGPAVAGQASAGAPPTLAREGA
jgi:radical SAM protein with 4Fe4S-binding SPASM domain